MSDLIKYGYAPGRYDVECRICGGEFLGDKRAKTCKGCAISTPLKKENAALRSEVQRWKQVVEDAAVAGTKTEELIEKIDRLMEQSK